MGQHIAMPLKASGARRSRTRVRLSPIQWAAARGIYESDPTITLQQIADSLGCSRAAVSMRIKRGGWVQRQPPQSIAERANAAADSKFEAEQREKAVESDDRAPGVCEPDSDADGAADPTRAAIRPPPVVPAIPPGTPEDQAGRMAVDTANGARAELVRQHRKEWGAVRSLAYASIKSRDMEAARHVKVVAESLKIVQDGERRAWGLDTDEKKPPTVQVSINRRAGVTIGH
ncbi:hypothetical protein [Paraburkholderia sp. A1RO-5L]|uniref:hypothetical protein n=1 Tax=unclassified Paraburkholderia TaxID=2615204 RepID=UPI003B787331